METANLILDIVLIAASIWMIVVIRGLGGIVGRTLTMITAGAVVLGLAHVSETIVFDMVMGLEIALIEFLHRIIVLLGFVLLVVGFRQLTALDK
jgi:hypothetical protein